MCRDIGLLWWNGSTRMLRSPSGGRLQPTLQPTNAGSMHSCTSKLLSACITFIPPVALHFLGPPRSSHGGPTAPARWRRSPRSLPPPSPPSATSLAPAAATRARCAPRAKNRTGTCVHASQPRRPPPTAATAASALAQPTVHATYALTRLVRAALAVVPRTPASRRQGHHRAPAGRCSGRCGVHAPPQVHAGVRGRRQCVQGCTWRARSARGRSGRPFEVPAATARRRPLGRRGGFMEAAPGGSGLAWGCWVVAPGPDRATRERLRSRCGRCRA